MTRTQDLTDSQAAELVCSMIQAAGPVGITAEQIREQTGLSRSQVKAAIAVVLTMRWTVPDVDAALSEIGDRRLLGGDPAAERRRNGL